MTHCPCGRFLPASGVCARCDETPEFTAVAGQHAARIEAILAAPGLPTDVKALIAVLEEGT